MADMAESMEEFRGGPFTASILEAPGMAWWVVLVEAPGLLMGSDTLLLSFGMRRARDDLLNVSARKRGIASRQRLDRESLQIEISKSTNPDDAFCFGVSVPEESLWSCKLSVSTVSAEFGRGKRRSVRNVGVVGVFEDCGTDADTVGTMDTSHDAKGRFNRGLFGLGLLGGEIAVVL